MSKEKDINWELYIACQEGLLRAAELLIEAGANVDSYINIEGRTCLHEAARWGTLSMVELLVSKGAKSRSDFSGNTPLDLAIKSAKKEIIFFLMKYEG